MQSIESSSLNDDEYITINSKENIKWQFIKLSSFNDNVIINTYNKNNKIILHKQYGQKNVADLIQELCKKSKHIALKSLLVIINDDITKKKINEISYRSIKQFLSKTEYSLLTNAVWLSKNDSIEFFDKNEMERQEWIKIKMEEIIKTIIVIINDYNHLLLFHDNKIKDKNNNFIKDEKDEYVRESIFGALLNNENGFNKNDDKRYSQIIYDKLTGEFPILFKDIKEYIIMNLFSKFQDISINESFYNDSLIFMMYHYPQEFIMSLIKEMIFSACSDNITSVIEKVFIIPKYHNDYKRFFQKIFANKDEDINNFRLKLINIIINEKYNLYIEAIKLFKKEVLLSLDLEKNNETNIEEKINNFRKDNKNIFFNYYNDNMDYLSNSIIKDEVEKLELYSDKLKYLSKIRVKRMSDNFHMIFGYFYKNNFVRYELIQLLSKNNFEYTNISCMLYFINFSNIKSFDTFNIHYNMMISFKKKYESSKLSTKLQYEFNKIYEIYQKPNNQRIIKKLLIRTNDKHFSPISEYSSSASSSSVSLVSLVSSSASSRTTTPRMNEEYKIGSETPIFNKNISLLSPITLNELDNIYDLPIPDENLVILFSELNPENIKKYIQNKLNLTNDDIIISFLDSFKKSISIKDFEKKIDKIKILIIELKSIIEINKNTINELYIKYDGIENDLKCDNPHINKEIQLCFD